jgi:hypothetical protein
MPSDAISLIWVKLENPSKFSRLKLPAAACQDASSVNGVALRVAGMAPATAQQTANRIRTRLIFPIGASPETHYRREETRFTP